MDPRLQRAPVVEVFAEQLRERIELIALWCGGSLAMGDYRPPASDLDLVAVVGQEPDGAVRRGIEALHRELIRERPDAAKLHCVHVPRGDLARVESAHLTWSNAQLFRRPLSGVARAELHARGIVVLGPAPGDILPPVDAAALRQAARAELTGYWRSAVRKPWLWQRDLYVDLGLLTLARVEATLTEDRLITKQEALARLATFEVPIDLRDEIARRRHGHPVRLTRYERWRRGVLSRRLVARGIRRLT